MSIAPHALRLNLVRRSLTAVVIVASSGHLAFAQTTTATIEGVVIDRTGAAIVAATVEVLGETSSRSLATDGEGAYRATGLVPGLYTIVSRAAGFRPVRVDNIEVAINRTATVNLRLELAAQAESVLVRIPPPLLDLRRSSLSTVISGRQIASVPLNGRNYLDLIALTPGVVVNSTARADLSDRDTRGSILGERAANAGFLIDGLENNDDFRGGAFQAYTQDAIQEFEVIASGYKAEFGRGSGGIVNAITRSGTNETHGSTFFFLRDDALDASNVDGADAPELARYNGGFTVGGPVVRDRAWYFGSFEHLFERRQALFPSNIPALLSAGEDFSKRPETESTRLFGKYARGLTAVNELRIEGSWSRLQNANQLASAIALPSASNDNDTKTFLGSATYTSVVTPRVLLESSVGYRDQRFNQNGELGEGFSYTVALFDAGTFDFGPRYSSKQTLDQDYLTLRETLSLSTGHHAGKVGLEYVYTSVDGSNGQGLQNVIATTSGNFSRFGLESFQIPQGIGFIDPGDETSRMRNNGVSVFAQDDYRFERNVTLNLGVRYDYDSRFNDGNNVAPRLGIVWAPDQWTSLKANWGIFYDRYRLGLAQAIPELGGFNGRTVVETDYPRLAADAINRAGGLGRLAAIAGDPFLLHKRFGLPETAVITRGNVQQLTGLTPEQFLSSLQQYMASFGAFLPVDFSPSTGYLRQDLGAALQDRVTAARPFRTPYNNTLSVGAERVVVGDLTAGLTFVHRSLRNVLGVRVVNLSPQSRVVGTPITTDGGPIQRTYGPWYDGTYNAVIASFDKRFNGRYQALFNYTYARGKDNLLNPNLGLGVNAQGGGAVPTDNLNLEFDRGNSDFVVPHSAVASGIVNLPIEMSVSGVVRATSGNFFSAAGALIDYDGDAVASTLPQNTRRNEFRGPRTVNVDLRLEKRFVFDRYSASGLIEFFNLFNARNPRLIDNIVTPAGPGPSFGNIRVPLPGREVQIGLRLTF